MILPSFPSFLHLSQISSGPLEMTKEGDAKFLKIQTCVLKVNIHCDGCKHKVKKLLQKIEGVYTVNIDTDQQKVTVSGSVDPSNLINKLIRSGKHAELWSPKGNHQHNHQQQQQKHHHTHNKNVKEDKGTKEEKHGFLNKGPKKQQKPLPLISDDDSGEDSDDELDDYDEGALGILREKARRIELQKRQNDVGNKKNKGGSNPPGIAGNTPGKKGAAAGGNNGGNQNLNSGFKNVNGDKKNQNNVSNAANNKVNNAHHSVFGSNIGDHGRNGLGLGYQALGGGNSGAGGGFGMNIQGNGGFQGCGYPNMGVAGCYGGGLNGLNNVMYQYQQHPMAMMNNINNRPMNERYMQMIYNRAPLPPPATTAYFQYQPQSESAEDATYLFSDDNANSCAIM